MDALLEEIASPSPDLGGGGVACIVGAMGISLNRMALTLSKKEEKSLEKRQVRLLELSSLDGLAYKKLLEAYRMDKGDPRRKMAIQEASKEALSVPLEAYKLLEEVLLLQETYAKEVKKNVVSDVFSGHAMIQAAMESLLYVIYLNGRKEDIDMGKHSQIRGEVKEKIEQVRDDIWLDFDHWKEGKSRC